MTDYEFERGYNDDWFFSNYEVIESNYFGKELDKRAVTAYERSDYDEE